MEPRAVLRALFQEAVLSAQPSTCLAPYVSELAEQAKGSVLVVGAGKAAAQMAAALEQKWPVSAPPLTGVVVTRYGHGVACSQVEVIEAAHPVPDANSVLAAQRILSAVSGSRPDDLIICLLSGGASSLLCAPPPGVTLEDKQALNRALLHCGATIAEINCVRKSVSLIKGGRLAEACAAAQLVTLAISDVPGDDPAILGSGPTAQAPLDGDPLAILQKYGIQPPSGVYRWLEDPASKPTVMTTRPYHIIASPAIALQAAAKKARSLGWQVENLGDSFYGDAREVAVVHAKAALRSKEPRVILSGGETSIVVRGNGVGGRNVEFLIALALELNGAQGIYALAADTDGVDGMADVAGAFIDPSTLQRAKAAGFSLEDALTNNDAHSLFKALSDQVITGPSGTNVNDFRALLIQP